MLRFDGDLAPEDGVDHVGGTDILVSWVPILVLVLVFLVVPVSFSIFLGRVVLGGPPRIDVFEDGHSSMV